MKRKTIITSVLVIVLCLGLISGSTFALFTSESSVNIAVTSGKVKLVASLDTLKVYSANPNLTGDSLVPVDKIDPTDNSGTLTGTFAGTYYYETMPVVNNTTGTFANGGTAIISDSDQTLTLTNVTPGDKVSVNVNIENSSNVKIKYRIRVNVLENENEETASSLDLFNGLVTKIDGTILNGVIRVNNWTLVDPSVNNGEIADVPVEIYLPLDAGNEYQGKTTQIRIIVEAVQNNAATSSELETINAYLSTKEPKTMYDAITSLVSANILELTTYADAFAKVESYLWNVDTNQFYAEENATDFAYKYFKAYTYDEFDALTAQTYSVYAYDGGTTPWTGQTVNVNVGFDAGVTTNIASVSFARDGAYGKDFIIRTNSAITAITVNAPKDIVRHYDLAGSLNIIEAANSSVHEYGKVAFVEIAKGRYAMESGAEVDKLHFNTKTKTVENNVVTEKVANVFDEIIIAYANGVELPEFHRDTVEIASTGTLVVELQSDTNNDENTDSDYVWLFKQGVISQMVVTEDVADGIKKVGDEYISYVTEGTEEVKKETVALGVITKVDETKKAANEIANNYTGNNYSDSMTIGTDTVNLPKLDANDDIEIVPGVATKDIAEKLGENKTVDDVISASKDEIANAVVLVDDEKKSTELQAMTAYEIVEVVGTVESSGLSETEKEEVKTEVVEEISTEQLSDSYSAKIVGKNVGYETIQKAIDAAADGDVIKLLNDKTETISINGKTLTLDLNEKALTHGAKDYAVTVYDTNGVTIKNGKIYGQIRIGEHQPTNVKWKKLNYGEDNYEAVSGYHPLAPARNVLLKDLTVDSGNEPSLFFTNIEDDLVRGAPSNYCDNDLYGHYIYKTGYTNKDQYISSLKGEVFTVCNDKDSVTVDGGSYTGSSFVGNMVTYKKDGIGEQIEGVLTVREGTRITNAAAGRYLESGTILVGSNSNTFVTSKTTPTEYIARINDVYYTYAGGANDAIKFARIGETVYINENANAAKEIAQDETFTVVSLKEGVAWTGATVTRKVENPSNYEIVEIADELNPLKKVYTIKFSVVARVYHVGDTRQMPKSTTAYDEYGSLKAAVEAAGAGDYVMLMKDTVISDESVINSDYVKYGINLSAKMVLDLNGHTYTYTGSGTAIICTAKSGTDGGQRAIRDTSAEKTGTVYATKGYAFAKYNQDTEKTVIYGGNFVSATTNAIWIKNANVFEIQGGRFISLNNITPIRGTPTSISDGVVTIQTNVSSEQYLTVNSDGTYEVNSLTKIDDDNYTLTIPVDKMVLLPAITKVGYIYNWELADDSHKVNSGFVLNSSENEIIYQTNYTELTEFKVSLTTSNANVTVKVNGEDWDGISNVNYGDIINVSVEYTETNSQKCTIKDQNGTTYNVATDFEMPRANLTIDASSSAPSCLVQGTLITMADGTQKPVESLTGNELLLTWDFVNGEYVTRNIFSVTNHGEDLYLVTKLVFSDETEIKLIAEHGMLDADLNKFVNITTENAHDYIGHRFVKRDVQGNLSTVELLTVTNDYENTTAYSIIAIEYLDVFANEFLTLDPSIYFLFPFSINDELKFDSEEMMRDIETYGLMEYEEFKEYAPYMTEEQFIAGSGKYIKIALGKNIISMEEIMKFALRILIDQQYIV